jgi:transposase
MNRRIRIQRLAPQDREAWQKLYYRHQEHRPRRRLLALKAVWDGQTLAEVCRTQHLARKTLERWLDGYLHGGFRRLLAPERRRVPQALSLSRRRVLRYILLQKTPADYGLDSYQWTARQAQALLEAKWGIHLGLGRLYQLFDQFGISHQRVHRDYGPPRPPLQATFVATLEKKVEEAQPLDHARVALDEFALRSVPDTHYAWAERNTAPRVPSDERQRTRLNGFLTVDLHRGLTEVQFRPKSKTEDVVLVVVLAVLLYVQRGCRWITLILDNARTHRHAMEEAVKALLAEIAELVPWEDLKATTVEFLHTPPYSPALNPAEYLIHSVRQEALYHLPCTFTLQEKADRVRCHLVQGPPFTPEQMQKLLRHIYKLPKDKSVKWPKLE